MLTVECKVHFEIGRKTRKKLKVGEARQGEAMPPHRVREPYPPSNVFLKKLFTQPNYLHCGLSTLPDRSGRETPRWDETP